MIKRNRNLHIFQSAISSPPLTVADSGVRLMRMPGVEPGSQAWEACMMPLHYMRQ